MVAALQGFPDDWRFFGRKTSIYRQIASAYPPTTAAAIGRELSRALVLHRE
jgi:DNA (cytosine-5)-methyltransferase 1